MDAPNTTAGGKLLSCELDDACSTLDCAVVMEDYAEVLLSNADGEAFVAHYCGRQYLQKAEVTHGDDE